MTVFLLTAGVGVAFATTGSHVQDTDGAVSGVSDDVEDTDAHGDDGGEMTADEVVQEATESYENINSFKATLTTQTSAGEVSTETKATLWYAKDGKYRIEYQESEYLDETTMVWDGSEYTVYNESSNTVYKMDSSDDRDTGMDMNFLESLGTGLEEANLTYEGTATVDGHETHVLEVHGETEDNTTSMIYLDADNYLPRKSVSETSYDGETMSSSTTFSNIGINCVSDDKFTFEAPEDAEVVDLTENESDSDDNSSDDSDNWEDGESEQSDEWDDCEEEMNDDDAKEGDDDSDRSDGDSDSGGDDSSSDDSGSSGDDSNSDWSDGDSDSDGA
ncbi:Outer membrane lipoprotein-sorting protein [Haladaptatus litoreus]|uniref:Outer membrane lipoprotein-sorting protein n=2 Tax=Haladaptatus litoreus TaxID=553468 RepID=A0A1N6Z0Z1_9EURY|nr:Outer membrane lipoprotein-sorting protein [Haladaptatus litoreus]